MSATWFLDNGNWYCLKEDGRQDVRIKRMVLPVVTPWFKAH
ncbi:MULTISPECIES: hypothetical protein [Hungatella]|nr:hypothetical protein [Hungatella hathewayi]